MDPTFSDSLWSHLTPPGPDGMTPVLGNLRADVAVVGAGFLGLSTALHLAQAGISVALIEANEPGYGASGRTTGFVIPRFRIGLEPDELAARLGPQTAARLVDLVDKSADTLFDLVARLGIDCSAERSGWLEMAHSARMLPLLATRARQAADRGRPVQFLSAADTAAMVGTLGYWGAFYDASGGQLNPLAFARGLARACLVAGVTLAVRSPVSKLERSPAGWRLTTPEGTVTADIVVLATNALVGHLAPGVAASLLPVVVHQIATERLTAAAASVLPRRTCVSDTRRHTFAVRRSPDDRLMTGGIVPIGPAMLARARKRFTRRLAHFFPQAAPFHAAFTWRGVIALTSDLLPRLMVVGDRLYAPIGCNGRGVALTTALGRALADRLSGATAAEDFPLPETKPKPVFGRRAATIGPSLWLPWNSMLDWLDSRRAP